MMFTEEMKKAAKAYGLDLTEEQLGQFGKYYALLVEWNGKMNLTAMTEPGDVAVKHFIDSLSGWDGEVFQGNERIIDVGTGAGFPGIPLKIFQPGLRLTLLDSLNKRVRFLQAVVDALGLQDVACIHGRAEEAARDKSLREGFDIAVSRAVARLPVLAEYCLPFVRVGGIFLAWKGLQYKEEAQEAGQAAKILGGGSIRMRRVELPGLEETRAILCIPKERPAPKAYPRKAGTPLKHPLGVQSRE